MADKEEVANKALDFLEAVSREVQARLGPNPKVSQQAVWWSSASPEDSAVRLQSSGTSSLLQSGLHEREVFNSFGVNTLYQIHLMRDGFPEQTELYNVITASGIDARFIHYGFFVPLVMAWCKLPDPFDLTQPPAEVLLSEFTEAVIDGSSFTRYRDAIVPISLGGTPVHLEDGITIRPIDVEELWELGSETMPTPPFSLQLSPDENWSMLDIELRHRHDESPQIAARLYGIREAVVANLAIAVKGGFTILPIGMTTKFGPNATGRLLHGSPMPRQLGPIPGMATVAIDECARQQMHDIWPRVKQIMQASSHYLSLPLRRLVDGLGRSRNDDKIVDYAIGLEALLTGAIRDELRYRFALRGAMILEEAGENKAHAFSDLQRFYDARSAIVHGGNLSKFNLATLANGGEQFLRRIWNWYFEQNLETLAGATSRIDRRILASDK